MLFSLCLWKYSTIWKVLYAESLEIMEKESIDLVVSEELGSWLKKFGHWDDYFGNQYIWGRWGSPPFITKEDLKLQE